MEAPIIDVIIVAYRSEAFLPRLLEDLRSMSRMPHTVHLFDNIGNPKTLSIAWNDLAAQGSAEYIAVMNPDIALSPGWDERLVLSLRSNVKIGVVMPDPCGSSPTSEPIPSRDRMAAMAAEHEHDRTVELKDITTGNIYEFRFYLPLMARQTWESMKGLDERLRFYRQDSDFFGRVRRRLGKLAAYVHACPVWHRGAASTSEAIARGEIDPGDEYSKADAVWKEIREGRWKEWDLLSDDARRAVRSDPRFNRMGVR